MTSKGLGEMFEGDSVGMCAGKFPLGLMGGRAEGLIPSFFEQVDYENCGQLTANIINKQRQWMKMHRIPLSMLF